MAERLVSNIVTMYEKAETEGTNKLIVKNITFGNVFVFNRELVDNYFLYKKKVKIVITSQA